MVSTGKEGRVEISITIPSTSLTAIFKNNKFGTSRYGRIFLRNNYRRAIKELAEAIACCLPGSKAPSFTSTCPVAVDIQWSRGKGQADLLIGLTGQKESKDSVREKRADVDAPVSGILDALQLAGVIENDKYVSKIICEKK